MNDFRAQNAVRRSSNPRVGRGFSNQFTDSNLQFNAAGALTYASRAKILRMNKGKNNASGLSLREQIRRILRRDINEEGKVHGNTKIDAENFAKIAVKSQKAGWGIAVRPLVSYKEKNTERKMCAYGSYKDGSRWRCVQNLNHKKGGKGSVKVRRRADGEPDQRTGVQSDDEDDDGGDNDDKGGDNDDNGGGDEQDNPPGGEMFEGGDQEQDPPARARKKRQSEASQLISGMGRRPLKRNRRPKTRSANQKKK